MLTQPRILRYMPPEQMQAADMLIRQNNHKVLGAIMRQTDHLFRMQEDFNFKLSSSESIAWIHYFKPATGQEWYITEMQDKDAYCLYFTGEFTKRLYCIDDLKMKDGIVLDIYWEPTTLKDIKANHQICEYNICSVPYARIMRRGFIK